MGPYSGPTVLLLFIAIVKVSYGYLESLASNVDVSDVTDKTFVPMVAFWCSGNHPAMHTEAHGWVADYQGKMDCPGSNQQILKYCQTLYKDRDITNVVDVPKTNISSWPDKNGNHPRQHTVRAYRCVVGAFESDALLVPQHCEFNHEHDNNKCADFETWHKVGAKKCTDKNMVLDGYAMLMDCNIDMFKGVEYVCCPKGHKPAKEHVIDVPGTLKPKKTETHEIVLNNDEKEDAYIAYLRGDNGFLDKRFYNEHEKFLAAEQAMKKRQHAKITRMMKEWQEAREHVNALKKTDPKSADKLNKDIMQRFQRLYSGYEQADAAEKKQLVALHQQHIQSRLNKRKREKLEKFMAELQRNHVRPHRVEKFLEGYIKAEEKDRIHTLNHFSHVRSTNPREAKRIQKEASEHLKVISERIGQSLDMLHHFPKIEEKVLPKIKKLMGQYKKVTKTSTDVVMRPFTKAEEKKMEAQAESEKKKNEAWVAEPSHIENDQESVKPKVENDGNEEKVPVKKVKLQPKVKNTHFDMETMENEHKYVAHHMEDKHSFQHQGVGMSNAVHLSTSTGSIFGIAIGSVAVFVIIVVAVIMLRKRTHRHPITHGFVEVDPAASPEERHVANMQMNGYENPTYKYFELGQTK